MLMAGIRDLDYALEFGGVQLNRQEMYLFLVREVAARNKMELRVPQQAIAPYRLQAWFDTVTIYDPEI
ncbi:hypothetical protein ACFX2J_020551 [Malus domestica]